MTPATSTTPIAGAASTLLARLVTRGDVPLVEVARTRLAVHYETGDPDVPVLCLATPDAVRLPNSFITSRLPDSGALSAVRFQVTRWWRPDRPTGLTPPPLLRLSALPATPYDDVRPDQLIGRGPGLTPEGDDVLAGALVTAYATDDPRLARWRAETRAALAAQTTSAVSRGLLHHALDGYAIPELARLLTVLCRGGDLAGPLARLRSVGHSSGDALLDGLTHTLTTRALPTRNEGAA